VPKKIPDKKGGYVFEEDVVGYVLNEIIEDGNTSSAAPKPGAAVVDDETSAEAVDESGLTYKLRMFVDHFLICGNASRAARLAGYSERSAGSIGSENLKKPEVKALIEAKMAEVAMSRNEVLMRLSQFGRGSIVPFLNPEGHVDLTTDDAKEHLHLVKKVKVKKRVGGPEEDPYTETDTEIELHDPQSSLVQMGRHHKLFTDKVDVEHANPIKKEDVTDYDNLEPGELNSRIEAALKDAPRG
jgi:phage terminase small subunit